MICFKNCDYDLTLIGITVLVNVIVYPSINIIPETLAVTTVKVFMTACYASLTSLYLILRSLRLILSRTPVGQDLEQAVGSLF